MIEPVALPPAAGPGDRVGVAALSGPVRPERLAAGVEALRRLGFVPVLADNLLARSRYDLFAGDDAERLAAFHRLAADPDLPAIFFARGGSGLLRVLPGIDWHLLARRPRAYVGYSDLTPFLLGVVERLHLAAFHGPLVAAELAQGLDPAEEASLLDALAGRYPAALPFQSWLREPAAGEVVAGPLLGGCLSLLTATLGTPFFPDLAGSILFWEDINEPPYRIDRMLTHLRLSANLANIKAMMIGHLAAGPTAGEPSTGPPAVDWPRLVESSLVETPVEKMDEALDETLDEKHAGGLSWPLAWGLDSGHLRPNLTLPLGLSVSLESGDRRLWLGEERRPRRRTIA